MDNVISMYGAWKGRIDQEKVGPGGFQYITKKAKIY